MQLFKIGVFLNKDKYRAAFINRFFESSKCLILVTESRVNTGNLEGAGFHTADHLASFTLSSHHGVDAGNSSRINSICSQLASLLESTNRFLKLTHLRVNIAQTAIRSVASR